MKKPLKPLLWVLILVMSISLVVMFSSGGCRRVEEPVEEPVVEEPVEEPVVEEPVEEPVVEEPVEEPSQVQFVGSKNSDVFHYLTCSYVKKIKEENKIYFSSYDDAVSKGYRPCKICKPTK